MSKPWHEVPLWERLYGDDDSYRTAVKLIGYLGVDAKEFWRRAAKLPNFNKFKLERAVNALTPFSSRGPEEARYELNKGARGCVRVLLGPPPEDPEYERWWRARLVSVRLVRKEGTEPEFATEPPVPLKEELVPKPKKEAAKRPRKKTG